MICYFHLPGCLRLKDLQVSFLYLHPAETTWLMTDRLHWTNFHHTMYNKADSFPVTVFTLQTFILQYMVKLRITKVLPSLATVKVTADMTDWASVHVIPESCHHNQLVTIASSKMNGRVKPGFFFLSLDTNLKIVPYAKMLHYDTCMVVVVHLRIHLTTTHL